MENTLTSWPWGEMGRPSDKGPSEGILAERPNVPGGVSLQQRDDASGKGGGITLIPNRMWRDVRTVQAHMEQARQHRATR